MPKFPFISFCCKIQIETLQAEIKKDPVRIKPISYVWWDSSLLTSGVSLGIDSMKEEEEHHK